jgi:uroporphyrin-III C-methyltransferase
LTLTLEALAMGEAQQWLDAAQPSLLMIGEAFAERSSSRNAEDRAGLLHAA